MRILYKWKKKNVCSLYFQADLKHKLGTKNFSKSMYKSILKRANKFIYNNISKSTYSQSFFEKQRFKVYYGIPKEKKFKRIAITAGINNFISFMESRLDIILWRIGFFGDLNKIRILIKTGKVFVNNSLQRNFEYVLKPGDEINFLPYVYLCGFKCWVENIISNIDFRFFRKKINQYFYFNSYLEFSPSTGRFILVNRPSSKDVYIPFKYSVFFIADLYHPNMRTKVTRIGLLNFVLVYKTIINCCLK